MGFLIIAVLLTGLIGGSILAVLMRPREEEESAPGAAHDLQVYRDQLQEIDRDLARGVLNAEEAERTRTEVARRLLEADKALQAGAGPAGANAPRLPAMAILALLLVGAGGVYWVLGAPGYPDLPIETRISLVEENRADRPTQAQAEAVIPLEIREDPDPQRAALMAQLRTEMERRPDDLEGLGILAHEEARLGNFRAARRAQERLVGLLGDAAGVNHLIDLAEMMFLSAGGYLSPEAEALINAVLARDPDNGTARYYAGLMYASQGRPDLGYSIWRTLLAQSQPDDPWLAPIRAQIEEVAALAGDPVTLDQLPQPQARPSGPSAEDIEAAGELSPEERMAMIQNMVSGLADRLATEGGSPQDWARLISSYIALGQTRAARSVYDEALRVFASSDSALELIRTAAAPLEETE